MTDIHNHSEASDPHDLKRFLEAQQDDCRQALAEIRSVRKRSHWMWYIFPQCAGLGFSSTSYRYAVKSVAEAEAYLRHPVLGPRLVECAEAAIGVEGRSAAEVFGSPDDIKLRSCATLFAAVSPAGSVFERVLDKFFRGVRDERTLRLMGVGAQPSSPPWLASTATVLEDRITVKWFEPPPRIASNPLVIAWPV